ncbi:MAG: MFS transporter [Promethearchaeota archaeon]
MGENEYKPGNKIAFAIGALSDSISYQTFTFLIFTFYFAVIGINVNLITIGFILWSVWNAINDPIAGFISDRTNTRWGRRIPYIAITFIPLSALMLFLWTPPFFDLNLSYLYFLVVIMIFDAIYTANSLNLTSLFPEMYLDESERASANNLRQIFLIIGLLIAFVTPTIFISDLSAKETAREIVISQYQLAGIVLAIIVAIGYMICLKWGVRERKEFSRDNLGTPDWWEAFKHTLSNRAFQWFLICNTMNWYVFGLLPTIIPLYGQFVLGIDPGESIILGLLLGIAFIFGAVFVNFWKAVANRIGDLRKTWMLSMALWIVTLIPFLLIGDVIIAFVTFAVVGIGLSGSLYLKDLIVSDIVDDDEIQTGVRREGAYYGTNALIMRLAVILVFISINLVFNSVGWTVFTPETVTLEVLLGLRLLMAVFPGIALAIGIVAISRYPLHGDRLKEMKEKQAELHKRKKAETQELPT